MRDLRFILGNIVLTLTSCFLCWAQTGSITGTVTDKSGAVVQGASVTVVSIETKATRQVSTGGTGAFNITNLPAGHYKITFTKHGFRTSRVDNAPLTVDQVLAVNAQLELGAVSEEVQVQGNQLPPVDLETAQVSNLVDSQQMEDLPLITRDPYSLVLLSPGTSQTQSSLGGFTVNGSRERNNNFLLDGTDNNDTSVPGIPDGLLSANPDSTQEFRVITNNFNAEYGRNTGAIIDVITKSGTNSFHGGAYEFGRWNGFGGARDWFNPAVLDGSPNPMNPYIRNQFGFDAGGPIIKNKTFFFFNDEIERFRTTLTNSGTAPTAAFRTGVFNFTNTNTGVTQPVNLLTTNNADGLAADPTVQKLFALYPVPASSPDGIEGTYFFPSSSQQNSYNTVAKIDHQFNSKHSFSGRYGYDHFFDPNPFHDDILPGNVGGVSEKAITQGVSANLTSTLKPTLVNNLVFGWNQTYLNFSCTNTSVFDAISGVDQFGNGIDYPWQAPFTQPGCLILASDQQFRKTGTTSYSDNITWVRGKHTFKFGADFRDVRETGPDSFFSRREETLGTFITSTGMSLINAPSNDPCLVDFSNCTLDNAASTFYGFVGEDFAGEFFNKNGVRQPTDSKLFRQHEYDWFGQDTWKVTHNLTLNVGLRYQLDGVPYEENANFSNLLQNPGSFQAGQNVVFSIVGPGTGNSLYKQDYSNIEPRVGLSWDPFGDGKTAIRAAFGIFHDRLFGNEFGNARGNPPFEQDYVNFPFNTIPNVPSVAPTTIPSRIIPDDSLLEPIIFNTYFQNPVSNNWNFGVQRQLPGNNVLDLSYVGSEAHYLFRNMDGNPPDPALVNQLVAFCSNPSNSFVNQFGQTTSCKPSQVSGIALYDGGLGPNDLGILPFNAVANNAMVQPFYQSSNANSFYSAMQLKVTHRMSYGLQVQGSYTWAHGLDDGEDPLVPGSAGNRTFPRNSRDLHLDWANSDYDIRNIAVINYIWDMPFGRGKGYLNGGALGRVLEGWQVSGITSIQGGHPFEVRGSNDSMRSGIADWAELTPGQNPFGPPAAGCAQNPAPGKIYFTNPCAFTEPAIGSGPSNVGRNQFYGPGYVNFNVAISKTTSITERLKLELRFEGYNVFNRPQFTTPGADAASLGNLLNSGLFGIITSTLTQPDGTTSARQLQVAAKLIF
jgi:outer membrane receptor protein involved in Fe transport